MEYADKIENIHRDLLELHGKPEQRNPTDGVEQLVATILSQNVADTNTERAMSRLIREYNGDYEVIENEDTDNLAEVIRPAGFQKTKAERIKRALEKTRNQTGGDYTLSFLEDRSTEDAVNWLTGIKGVGPKTANVVLSFHFDMPAMPVDTHVHRLAGRFSLIPENASNEKAHDLLNDRTPDDIKYSFHMLMIEHGRNYCSARDADCDNLVCDNYCDCEFC